MRYRVEFKREVLKHYFNRGNATLREVAWEFNIPEITLKRWRDAYFAGKIGKIEY